LGAETACFEFLPSETEYSRELEGHISEILETFDGEEDLIFSSTSFGKEKIYDQIHVCCNL
jgi:hypothetical protein